MAEISRDPEELVEQTLNSSHAYPDGFALFLGTMFAPTEDRGIFDINVSMPEGTGYDAAFKQEGWTAGLR